MADKGAAPGFSGSNRATLRSVALETNLHPSTVSRVLRGETITVSSSTKERIFETAERLGYRPDLAARGLRTRRSYALGLLIADIRDAVYAGIYRGAEAAARREGYQVLISSVGVEGRHTMEHWDLLADRGTEGMILATARLEDAVLKDFERTGVPFVLVSRKARVGEPYAITNNESGGATVTRHLIELGHRRIGFVKGTPGVSTTEGRYLGYEAALTEAGLGVENSLVAGEGFDPVSAAAAARELLGGTEPPTAIVASDDMMALAVCQVAREYGLRIPEDLSVTGFNDLPVATLSHPPLTTVRVELERMGAQAVDMLLTALRSRSLPRNSVLEPELVVRESSAPPRSSP